MISIIIPTYNEEQNIKRLQQNLMAMKGDFEVIFSDGFSTDRTFEQITYPKIQETKHRSRQMNAAAKRAQGDYLWFVHADSCVHPDSILAIESSGADMGCFTLKFCSKRFLMTIVAFNSNLRVRWRSIIFGDQGLFVKKEVFVELGGFKAIPLMEDYQFSLDAKRHHVPISLLDLPIYTSSRRFDERGVWRTIFLMQKLQWRYRQGHDVQEIFEEYNRE